MKHYAINCYAMDVTDIKEDRREEIVYLVKNLSELYKAGRISKDHVRSFHDVYRKRIQTDSYVSLFMQSDTKIGILEFDKKLDDEILKVHYDKEKNLHYIEA